jgi:hypothetical protein
MVVLVQTKAAMKTAALAAAELREAVTVLVVEDTAVVVDQVDSRGTVVAEDPLAMVLLQITN